VGLFGDNRDVEGATVMNACYGGTAALLSSVAWAESSAWVAEKPYAIYVAGDVAVYEAGPARPTGGCGAVAVLVGRDAPVQLLPGARASYAEDAYDFYKPVMGSEYPIVDGKDSQVCYARALDACYMQYARRLDVADGVDAARGIRESSGHVLFHSPYNKLVQQSFQRLLFLDAVRALAAGVTLPADMEPLRPWAEPCAGTCDPAVWEPTYTDRGLAAATKAVDAAVGGYDRYVAAGASASQRVGNTYTGALHANLLGLIDQKAGSLRGTRATAFSYGSGLIATMFGLDFPADHSGPFTVERIAETAKLSCSLDSRVRAEPEVFSNAMRMREAAYGKASFSPAGSVADVAPGAWYLEGVDGQWRRSYARKA